MCWKKSDLELVINAFISSCLDNDNSLSTCLNKSAISLHLAQNASGGFAALVTPVLFFLHDQLVNFQI